ncbi:MAG: BrnT family toxin [Zoogloeaceae bacterium]|nr:BrnT family toxin [Zoogloeaceae bacterium]
MVTYDEAKRRENLQKHGIDLAETGAVFDFPMETWEDGRQAYGEARHVSLGWLSGKVVYLVWTHRAGETRVISCRKGTKHETERYFKAFF